MISFFLGTQNQNFFKDLINIINKFNEEKKIIIIVPEQNSYHTEKKIIKISKIIKKEIEVLSFSRLAYKIFQNFGGLTKKTAKKANKIAILNMVLFQLKNNLPLYSFLTNKPNFAELILQTIEQIKQNQLNFCQLKQKLNKINDNNLKLKIDEFWLIFKTYNLKLKSIFADTHDSLNNANTISLKVNAFQNSQIFFSEFFSFNKIQLSLIETMAKQTNLGFNFYCDETNPEIFHETINTIKTIKKIAKKNEIETEKIKIKSVKTKSKTMKLVEKVLLNSKFKTNQINNIDLKNKNGERIDFFAAKSIFDEVDWVIIKIINLIKQGYNFSDITILTTNINLYKTALICSMQKFNLPFFIDIPISFKTMNLIKCCQNLIETTSNSSDLIKLYLNILKTDLTKFSATEIAIFENYIYIWNVENKNFNKSFQNRFYSLITLKNNDTDEIDTKIVTKIQKTLIAATKIVKNSQKNSKNIAINIIKALEILGISPNNFNSKNKTKFENFKLEWNSLISLLETIYESTKNYVVDIKQFKFLFTSTSQNLNVKQIPPTLNCILIGAIETTIPNEPKTMFILGANEFHLPQKQIFNNKLFSDTDLNKLNKLQINFGKTLNEQNYLNTIITYRAVCNANQNLFLSFIASNSSFGSNEPCQIFKKLKNFFKINEPKNNRNCNFLEKCVTKQMALKQFFLHQNKSNEQIEALKHYFKNYFKNFSYENQTNLKPHKCSPEDRFKHNISLTSTVSPSQIEQFFLCPFSYFCQYILKIKPIQKAEINKQLIGLAIHKILEKVISIKNFQNIDYDQLKHEIKNETKKFIESNLKINLKSTKNFIQTFQIYENILLKFCLETQKELKNSNFKPSFFEYEIEQNLKIKIENKNFFIEIVGKIDRIDTKIQNEKVYSRIIDYKTGNRKLKFSDLIHGLNLQMLIYAILINKSKLNSLVCAIKYVKVLGNLTKYNLNERNPSKEKIKNIKQTGFFNNGLVLLNNDDYSNIDENFFTKALPLKLTTKGKIQKSELENKILTNQEVTELFKFVKIKIKQMLKSIQNFDFKQKKHIINENSNINQNNCSFCPYSEICNPDSIEIIQHKNTITKAEFFNSILKELKNDL